MTDALFVELPAWLANAGLAGKPELDLLTGFCERGAAAGLPLDRAHVFIDTLHPIHEGRLFRWGHDLAAPSELDYGRTTPAGAGGTSGSDVELSAEDAKAIERWRRSPFYRMLQTGESLLRRRLTAEGGAEFSMIPELRAAGMTDYVAIINRFSGDDVSGQMDCVYSSWATKNPHGISDDHIA